MVDLGYILSGQFVIAQTDLSQILESSQKAQKALETLWVYIGDSPLLSGLLNLARSLSVVSLIFYSYKVYRKVLDDMDYRSIINAMIPAVILILLIGNPSQPKTSPVWQISVQMRNIIYFIDKNIMQDLIAGSNLITEQRVQRLDNYFRSAVDAVIDECLNSSPEPEVRQQCIVQRALPRIQEIQNLRSTAFGNNATASQEWFNKMEAALNAIQRGESGSQQQQQTGFDVGQFLSNSLRGFADAILDAIGLLIRVVATCTNYVIESGFVLASIIGPIALGFSLFPLPQKPVFVWLLGYMGLGIWKIGNNILAGLGAYILNRTDDFAGFNYVAFAIITGVFAPALGAGMASWSASQMAQGVAAGGGRVVQTATSIAAFGVGGALAKGAGLLGSRGK